MSPFDLKGLLRDNSGATAVEYAALASLIAVALGGAFLAVGNEVSTKFDTVETEYSAANSR